MSRARRPVVATSIAALVGACAVGGPYLYNEQVSPSYTVPQYNYAAGRRDFLTVVRGDPFGMEEAAFQDAVIEVLNRNQPRPQPTRFTADPGEDARPHYRTVLLFDAPRAMVPNAICRASFAGGVEPVALTTGPRREGDPVRVAAAFCSGGGAFTSVMGEVADVESVDDPAFDRLISQVVYALFPLRDEDRRDDRCVPGPDGC